MNDTELQVLRDWSAKKMGWYVNHCDLDEPRLTSCWCKGFMIMPVSKWLPDRPESGQIWQVVERMRELGWELNLCYETINPAIPESPWYAEFAKIRGYDKWGDADWDCCWSRENNPCLAILLAARATEK